MKILIHIPGEMRDRIKQAADADKRSMNGQIEWLLGYALLARDHGLVSHSNLDEWLSRNDPETPEGEQ